MSHRLFYLCLCYVSGTGNTAVTLLSLQGLRAVGTHQDRNDLNTLQNKAVLIGTQGIFSQPSGVIELNK